MYTRVYKTQTLFLYLQLASSAQLHLSYQFLYLAKIRFSIYVRAFCFIRIFSVIRAELRRLGFLYTFFIYKLALFDATLFIFE